MFFLLKGKWEGFKKLVYLAGMAILLRFLWGRGMFSFRYYEDYTSMYEWGMIGLYLIWFASIYMLVSKKNTLEEKLWAEKYNIIIRYSDLVISIYYLERMEKDVL